MTLTNIQNAAKELNTAKPLRSYCDVILKQVIEDLTNQVGRTNEAFMKRISEIRYAKASLERIHNETATKVNDITRNITRLEKELADKEGFVALCQTRLANRAYRPGPELCKDNVHTTLAKELQTLKETVTTLNKILIEVCCVVWRSSFRCPNFLFYFCSDKSNATLFVTHADDPRGTN